MSSDDLALRRGVPCAVVFRLAALGAVVWAAIPGLLSAEPAPGQGQALTAPPVAAFVERALRAAPSLAAERARLQAARAARPAADALPDPMIELEYRAAGFPRYTIGSDPMSMAGAMVRQPWLTGGRRQARRGQAAAEIDLRLAEGRATAAGLIAGVRLQYASLYLMDRERETLDDARELGEMLVATATSRYEAGETDLASVLRAQLELTRLDERLADLLAERRLVQATLNRLTNDPPDNPIGIVMTLPDAAPPAPPAALSDQASRSAPMVGVRAANVDLATSRVAASRQELGPNYSFGAGVFWQGGFDRMVTVNVGIELPFWRGRKQRALLAAAEHELEAARLELTDTEAEARAEADRMLIEWRLADGQVARYREAVLPQTSAAFDAARASYLTGRGDFTPVLEEFQRWREARVGLARREVQRYSAEVRLELLVSPPSSDTWMKSGSRPPAAEAKEMVR